MTGFEFLGFFQKTNSSTKSSGSIIPNSFKIMSK